MNSVTSGKARIEAIRKQNTREQQTLDALRAELRAMVAEEEQTGVERGAACCECGTTMPEPYGGVRMCEPCWNTHYAEEELDEELYDRIGLALFLNSVGQLRTEGIYEYMRSTVNPNASNAQIDAAIARYNTIFTPTED